jgi:hypothetical protein
VGGEAGQEALEERSSLQLNTNPTKEPTVPTIITTLWTTEDGKSAMESGPLGDGWIYLKRDGVQIATVSPSGPPAEFHVTAI